VVGLKHHVQRHILNPKIAHFSELQVQSIRTRTGASKLHHESERGLFSQVGISAVSQRHWSEERLKIAKLLHNNPERFYVASGPQNCSNKIKTIHRCKQATTWVSDYCKYKL
jgi:hypothetical protein|tara:strand:- start:83 stop:418 length:336 start_codon:yes stop_codon:yes gene_type:complete